MTRDEMNAIADEALKRHSRHSNLTPFRDEGRFRVLRFWLNMIFMVGAVLGMVLYFIYDRDTAIYILIAASIPKFIELTLRILKL